MKEHLTRVESHPGSTSYLSLGVQNELIHMMASTVRQSLLKPSTMVSCSTRLLIRYVEADFEKKTIRVRESFLGFIQIRQKDAESLVEDILKQLEKEEMELKDYLSQCYDNAAVMAGHRSGVHQRISEKNNLAVFVDCDNHSFSLVGVHAAKQDTMMVTFFWNHRSSLRVLLSFNTALGKVKNAVPVVVKSQSETKWSARTEAVKPVNKYLEEILQVLQDMIDNENKTMKQEVTQGSCITTC
ncbi:uncharacterized protein LOC106464330 [Limulus polyphemus]|uniref:Uncharacterized protein LOC106464330 n=1 Tax=Limulus polyphemus TaxID=6850 RepID=A0ABM1BDR5_LIMPO|nr:uncharacterized protein LOC106464330 [Limulus polyphemus]